MSTWPWMKDVGYALVDEPIEPVDEHDNRPAVKDLLEKHRSTVNKIRAGLVDDPLFDATKHDDLWLLRFAMSHKKSKPSIAAAKECLQFRNEHNLDDEDIRGIPPHKREGSAAAKYAAICDGCPIAYAYDARGLVTFLHFGRFDQPRLLSELTSKELQEVFVLMSEYCFQHLDFATRTTGRLTKNVRIIGFGGFSMKKLSIEQNRREGEIMGQMDNCYPQLLEKLFLCNVPSMIQIPWRILRPLMPKRVLSKMDFINPGTSAKEYKRLLKYVAEDSLRANLGSCA